MTGMSDSQLPLEPRTAKKPEDAAAAGVSPPPPVGEPAPARPRRKRPFALVILAGLLLLRAGLLLVVIASAFLADPQTFAAIPFPEVIVDHEEPLLLALLLGPFAVLLIISALGLLAFKRSGWLIAMVVSGLFVLFDIVGWFSGTGSDVWMVLNVITVFYLNQRDVRELVGDVAPAPPVARAHA
jgi:uncharacterized membrane protein (DUF2068 family)